MQCRNERYWEKRKMNVMTKTSDRKLLMKCKQS